MRAYAIAILGISKLKKTKPDLSGLKVKYMGVFYKYCKKEAMKIRNTIRLPFYFKKKRHECFAKLYWNNTLCIPKH